ncbi:hypothetical protein ACIQVO_26245 [Streptomyces sp. NPDC101062]|uniref:hypothetical protein n=1 Tax=unclassified Streptomyces TaxID=2593676 RepID=UPI0038236AA8
MTTATLDLSVGRDAGFDMDLGGGRKRIKNPKSSQQHAADFAKAKAPTSAGAWLKRQNRLRPRLICGFDRAKRDGCHRDGTPSVTSSAQSTIGVTASDPPPIA